MWLVGQERPMSEDLELKLAILDVYNEKYNKRLEAKAVVFDRNHLDYKKVSRHHEVPLFKRSRGHESAPFVSSISLNDLSSLSFISRFRMLNERCLKKFETWSFASSHLLDYKLLLTTRNFKKALYVCFDYLTCHHLKVSATDVWLYTLG